MPTPDYSDEALHFALTGDDLKARDDEECFTAFYEYSQNPSVQGALTDDEADFMQQRGRESDERHGNLMGWMWQNRADFPAPIPEKIASAVTNYRRPCPPYSQDTDAGILAVFGKGGLVDWMEKEGFSVVIKTTTQTDRDAEICEGMHIAPCYAYFESGLFTFARREGESLQEACAKAAYAALTASYE